MPDVTYICFPGAQGDVDRCLLRFLGKCLLRAAGAIPNPEYQDWIARQQGVDTFHLHLVAEVAGAPQAEALAARYGVHMLVLLCGLSSGKPCALAREHRCDTHALGPKPADPRKSNCGAEHGDEPR